MSDELVLDRSAEDHDQNTIFQQNNAQQNEIVQSIIEARRQTVAEFEQRMRQQDQIFQQTMQIALHNQELASARASGLQQQAQVQNHSQSTQDRAQATAEFYASMGTITILP